MVNKKILYCKTSFPYLVSFITLILRRLNIWNAKISFLDGFMLLLESKRQFYVENNKRGILACLLNHF